LPAENYAIKAKVHPDESTKKNIVRFREQIKSLGLSYDWSREITTSDPSYYKWTQWLFIKLYEKGLAYKKEASVNWCPSCQTVLANEQVISGECERCGTIVIQKMLSQWFFKITDYADRLLEDMEKLDWPEPIKLMQKNWIGKSEGAEIVFPIVIPAKAGIQNQETGSRIKSGMTTKNALLIHGLNGHVNENWKPWLKAELEKNNWAVSVPLLPKADHPIISEWNEVLAGEFKGNSVIVGHSLGCAAALNLVQTMGKKVHKLILVAPVNPKQKWQTLQELYPQGDWNAVKSFTEIKFDWKKISDLVGKIIIYYSDNDPYIPLESIDFYRQNLPNAIFKFMPGKGHLNRKAGMIEFPELLGDIELSIKVFTTRPDTIFGATYIVLAPEHPLVEQITMLEQKNYVINYVIKAKEKTELQRTALEKEKTGVFTGAFAINPATKEHIPIWIADYVIMNYGTGAIMAVPAHDERDFEFAKKYKLPIKQVVQPLNHPALDAGSNPKKTPDHARGGNEEPELFVGEGKIINSGKFNGLKSDKAISKMTEEFGKLKVQYKLRDWLVSRQRYWGAPIPIVYCDQCGMQVVAEKDLPVLLPTDVDFKPTGESPLTRSKEFNKNIKCPKCGGLAKRDADTMDTFVDSSWYFFRFTDPFNKKEFAGKKEISTWLPVDLYVGGAEHAVMHLLYARFFNKALFDLGYLCFSEPFIKLRNQGLILGPDGEKMSKSRGNVINPDEVIAEFGADVFRMYEMFMGPLEDAKPWDTKSIIGVRRFLDRVGKQLFNHHFEYDEKSLLNESEGISHYVRDGNNIHKLIKKVTEDIEQFKFNTAIAAFMEFLNKNENLSKQDWETFLKLLAPFAPHITEELWHDLGNKESIHLADWPKFDPKKTKDDTVVIAVQILGRLRGTIVMDAGAKEGDVKAAALRDEKVKKHLEGKEIVKVIIVPDKLINFVTR